uniref:Uncharacterized protein n=1 Tax=Timema cristinae TaxID=61476 RepID=A0A7R9GVS1_TIMCR|nr:unnamed protein product [Timema cristinae]
MGYLQGLPVYHLGNFGNTRISWEFEVGRMPFVRAMSMEQRWQDLANLLSLPGPVDAAAAANMTHPFAHHHHHHHYHGVAYPPDNSRSVLLHNATLAPPVGDLNTTSPYSSGSMIGVSNLGSAVATSMNLTNSSEPMGDTTSAAFKTDTTHDMMYYQVTEVHRVLQVLAKCCNDLIHSDRRPQEVTDMVSETNSVILNVLQQVVQFRQEKVVIFSPRSKLSAGIGEYLPWTTAPGKRGLQEALTTLEGEGVEPPVGRTEQQQVGHCGEGSPQDPQKHPYNPHFGHDPGRVSSDLDKSGNLIKFL